MTSKEPESTKGKTGRTKRVVGGGYNTKWCSF
jgi:hypothetical protein